MSEYPSTKTPASLGFQNAQVYSFMDFDPDEHEETHGRPPMQNVFAASIHVARLIRNAGFQYALLGGTAIAALGAERETSDVDMGTNAKMSDLWRLLDDPRVILPDTKLISEMVRLFVCTGPDFGDGFIDQSVEIPVDIMIAGGNSVPRNIDQYVQMVDLQVGTLPVRLAILDVFILLRGKLSTFSARQSEQDFTDCVFLLETFDLPPEKANKLDEIHRREFVESSLFKQLMEPDSEFLRNKLQISE